MLDKMLKKLGKYAIWENKTKKNAKTHSKYTLWRQTSPKTSIFSVFELVTYMNGKIHAKQPKWGDKKDITRNMYYECF